MWNVWKTGEVHTGLWVGNLGELIGSPMRRWEDIIKTDLTRSGMGRHGLDSYDSGKGQVAGSVNAVMNLRVL
jgi:hypothetical protein